MNKDKVSIYARVRITLDIPINQGWSSDCNLEQVYRQAKESAINELRLGLSINGLINTLSRAKSNGTIVGDPQVTTIIINETNKAD